MCVELANFRPFYTRSLVQITPSKLHDQKCVAHTLISHEKKTHFNVITDSLTKNYDDVRFLLTM